MIFSQFELWGLFLLFLAFQGYSAFHVLVQTIAGRALGVRVEVVSIGSGPAIIRWRGPITTYSLAWIPLGGYTIFAGLNPDEVLPSDDPGAWDNALSNANKLMVLASGASSSVLLALLVLVSSMALGRQEPLFLDQPVRVAWCRPASALHEAGLRPGDEIVSANYGGATIEVPSWRRMLMVLAHATGSTLRLEVRRGKKSHMLTARLEHSALSDVSHQIEPVLGQLDEDSMAFKAGFRAGDRIVTIDRRPIRHWLDIYPTPFFHQSKLIGGLTTRGHHQVVVKGTTGSRVVNVITTDSLDKGEDPMATYGFVPRVDSKARPRGLAAGATGALQDLAETIHTTLRLLFWTGEHDSEVARRVPRNDLYKDLMFYRFTTGGSRLVLAIAFIGLWMGMFNLLPVPGTCGGHILFELLYIIRRRSNPDQKRTSVGLVGFFVSLGLMVYFVVRLI